MCSNDSIKAEVEKQGKLSAKWRNSMDKKISDSLKDIQDANQEYHNMYLEKFVEEVKKISSCEESISTIASKFEKRVEKVEDKVDVQAINIKGFNDLITQGKGMILGFKVFGALGGFGIIGSIIYAFIK